MSNLTEWIAGLCIAAGIKDEEKIKALKEKLGDFDIGEENQTLLNQNVMLKEAAKNNSELASYFRNKDRANFGDKIDATIYQKLEDSGMSEEEISEFKKNFKNKTIEAVSSFYDMIKAKHQKAIDELPKGTGKDEINKIKESYQKQIDDLNKSVLSHQDEMSEIKRTHQSELNNLELYNKLASRKYANKYTQKEALILADINVKEKMKEKGLQLVREDGTIQLKKQDGDTLMDYFENNKKVSVDDFINNVVADTNMLAVQGAPSENPKPDDPPPSEGVKDMISRNRDLRMQVSPT